MEQEPTRPRCMLAERQEKLSLILPGPSSGLALAFVGTLGLGPIAGLICAVALLLGSGWPFFQLGLALFGILALFAAAAAFCWLLAYGILGRQAVTIGPVAIEIRRVLIVGARVLRLGRADHCPLAEVRNLRLYPSLGHERYAGAGPLAFDCQGRTIWFGHGLNEAEVRSIWELLRRRFPAPIARG